MHPGEHELLAYMDDELPEEERRSVARHLEVCAACAGSLEELRGAARRFSAVCEAIDRPTPEIGLDALRRRAAVHDLATARARDRSPAAVERPRRSLLAAAALLIAFTGAAAAIPGSPLRVWLVDSARAIASVFAGDEESPPSLDQEAVEAATRLPSGVAVDPYGGRVWISIRSSSPDILVRVRLVDEPRASVLAADARYRTGPGRIEVLGASAGEVRVSLPRSASAASVEVNGRVVIEKEGGDLRLLAPADTSGSEIFFRPAG